MGVISDCGDGELCFFRSDFEQKGKFQEELQKAIECIEYTSSTYGEDTEEWKESDAKLEDKRQELSRQIELSLGFGELGRKLNNSEEDKIWTENEETRRRGNVENQLPAILGGKKKMKMLSGRRFRKVSGKMGIGPHFQNNRRLTLTKRRRGMLSREGARMSSWAILKR